MDALGRLEHMEAHGRAQGRYYCCEGTPEQCADNPPCTFYVGMATEEEAAVLEDDPVVDDFLRIKANAEAAPNTLAWNPAVYYCGSPDELSAYGTMRLAAPVFFSCSIPDSEPEWANMVQTMTREQVMEILEVHAAEYIDGDESLESLQEILIESIKDGILDESCL